jgi:hypothetical protein
LRAPATKTSRAALPGSAALFILVAGRDFELFLCRNHGAFGATLLRRPRNQLYLDQEAAGIWRPRVVLAALSIPPTSPFSVIFKRSRLHVAAGADLAEDQYNQDRLVC